VLTPTVIEPLALRGIELLERQLQRIGTGMIRCIVPTMFDSRQRQAHDLLTTLRQQYGRIVTEPIRVNVRLSEAPAVGRTIYEHDPRSRGALDYAQLVEHVATLFDLRPARSAVIASHPVVRDHPRSDMPVSRHPAVPTDHPAQPQANGDAWASAQESPLFHGPTHEPCPTCNQPLQQTVLAGYRVRYCNHCHYKRQELVQGARR
jgi:chromosome partitioning protein